MFNPRTRGLRERVKTMEDVAYFLVRKIEGKGIKAILSTYPCAQPSESLAFRTSLTKYLESIRHQSIYPSSSARSSTNLKPSTNDSSDGMALWWKDVVVRRSLLEECSGEKFERLLLSLSTHTVMKTSGIIIPDTMNALLRSQPIAYASALARYQAERHSWTKSASLLTRSKQDLNMLRANLESHTTSRYPNFSTARLQALAESKKTALLQQYWVGKHGREAFDYMIELGGLKPTVSNRLTDIQGDPLHHISRPSPLPVAAAHHPTHLKKFRRSVFHSKPYPVSKDGEVPPVPSLSHAEIILAGHLDCEKRMRQTISDALTRTRRANVQLSQKLQAAQEKTHATEPTSLFWTIPPNTSGGIVFAPEPDKALMVSLGLEAEYEGLDPQEDLFQRKIEEIREALPAYPVIPDRDAPRLPPIETKIGGSKIPLTKVTASKPAPPNPSLLQVPVDAPKTPSLSPSKSSHSVRRKSVRFSTARRRTGRPSLFRLFSGHGALEDEIDRLVDETHDFPTDDEDTDTEGAASPYKTPRGKPRPKINRIWTAGTPRHETPKPKARQSSALALLLDRDPEMGLPSLNSSTSSNLFGGEDSDDECVSKNIDVTPRPPRRSLVFSTNVEQEQGDDEYDDDDLPSMTLKEILLTADTSHFDLLEADSDDMEDAFLPEDTSFVWE
ncbi:hypothetical protein M413DRAFT_447859 [Hebeloma cylindrosporum]|uniref:HAUS augmin-like complex subunit 6 N-terminal domain-containing protein n=1 Tax=Hebeloma cylindrosporum TaxID=76867 RepID=A0A0C3C275_HEBCY|nr:hypothetical protein M413DRAFT_447859 [Hebeloma cylindrosporum h7]